MLVDDLRVLLDVHVPRWRQDNWHINTSVGFHPIPIDRYVDAWSGVREYVLANEAAVPASDYAEEPGHTLELRGSDTLVLADTTFKGRKPRRSRGDQAVTDAPEEDATT